MLYGLPLLLAEINPTNRSTIAVIVAALVLLGIAFANRTSRHSPQTETYPSSLTLLGVGAAYPFSIRGQLGGFKVSDVENLVSDWAQERHGSDRRPCVNPWVGSAMAPFDKPPYDNVVGFIIQGTICLHGEEAISILRDLSIYVARQLRATQVYIVHVGQDGTPQQFVIPVPDSPRAATQQSPLPEIVPVS